MIGAGPSLAELRARVHKDRHREIGNWLARKWARPTAIYGTWLAVRLGLSAHQVTLAAIAVTVLGAIGLGVGTRLGFTAGVALLLLAFWLDRVDGQVARWRATASLDGVYLDYLMHHGWSALVGFGLGYGLASRSGDPAWAIGGFAIGMGWLLLGLHNDCRYKAFFQQLKRAAITYEVRGGAGGRPAPPPGWPRRGPGLLTWPAFKLCEPHVVLVGLAGLVILAWVEPSTWLRIWRACVRAMAVLAPSLATARIARAVVGCRVEEEFGRWFRPIA